MSSVYYYKKTGFFGVKLNGREVATAGLWWCELIQVGSWKHSKLQPFRFCKPSSQFCEAGGKLYDSRRCREIIASLSDCLVKNPIVVSGALSHRVNQDIAHSHLVNGDSIDFVKSVVVEA